MLFGKKKSYEDTIKDLEKEKTISLAKLEKEKRIAVLKSEIRKAKAGRFPLSRAIFDSVTRAASNIGKLPPQTKPMNDSYYIMKKQGPRKKKRKTVLVPYTMKNQQHAKNKQQKDLMDTLMRL